MHAISFDNVSLVYGQGSDSLIALEALTLDVAVGESIAIIGPSGCGKSSMLSMAAGLLQPSSGNICVYGDNIAGPRDDCALILQDFGLLPWKSVIENAALGLKIRHVKKSERNAVAQEALCKVELDAFEGAYPHELSGGMRQRLAIARALAINAKILLMDEPLSALDALLRERLQDTVLNLWAEGGYTQMIVTHSIEEAVFLGQRIVVMSSRPGRVVAQIDNPEMGDISYRTTSLFHERTNELRAILSECSSVVREEGRG